MSKNVTLYKCEGLNDEQKNFALQLGDGLAKYKEAGPTADFLRYNFTTKFGGNWMVFCSTGQMGANGPKHRSWISFATKRWTVVLFSLDAGFIGDDSGSKRRRSSSNKRSGSASKKEEQAVASPPATTPEADAAPAAKVEHQESEVVTPRDS